MLEKARNNFADKEHAVSCALTHWHDDAETNSFSKANWDSSIWVKSKERECGAPVQLLLGGKCFAWPDSSI